LIEILDRWAEKWLEESWQLTTKKFKGRNSNCDFMFFIYCGAYSQVPIKSCGIEPYHGVDFGSWLVRF
jgi:hypothetical protein